MDLQKLIDELGAKIDSGEDITKSAQFAELFGLLKTAPNDLKPLIGKAINDLKSRAQANQKTSNVVAKPSIDVSASRDYKSDKHLAQLFWQDQTSLSHPLLTEIDYLINIYEDLGFSVESSPEIDDDYHMFTSLNFPLGHPARDDYDTFMTTEGYIAPAHTSTMQNRVLKKYKSSLEAGNNIAVVIPGRVFRNEDVDVTHEHTFYQMEGVFVGQNVSVANLIATLTTLMNRYFGQELKGKLQPFYFPFTEPSFEFAIERPQILRKGNTEADQWLELMGCGMIHPNVLKEAGLDPTKYSGFAWGHGVERLVMMKHQIDDIRQFEAVDLDFLSKFGEKS